MIIEPPRIKRILFYLTAIAFLTVSGYVAAVKIIDLETYRAQIIAELQNNLKRPVSYKRVNISFSLGPALSFHNISIKEPDNSREFVTIENLTFRLDLLPLLRKQIIVHGLVANKLAMNLDRRKDGSFNISDLINASESPATGLKIRSIKIKNSAITFSDSLLQQNAVVTSFNGTDLFLEHISRGSKGSFKLSTRLGGGASGTLSMLGKVRLSPQGSPIANSIIDAKLTCKKIEAAHFWPYYKKYVPFEKVTGVFDTDSEIRGKLSEFTSSGSLSAQRLKLDYQPVFKQVISSRAIQIKYSVELTKSDFLVKAIEVDIDKAQIKGSCAIKDFRGKDPRITAQAVSTKLDFEKYKQFIPYGIIVKDPAEWIEQHLAAGIFQLEEGRLDGTISQILHMELNDNYNILYIRARAEKGVVSYGSAVPQFNNIKGTLELKGKDFHLHGMSGNFGTSPMTLEGRITDYPLDKPSGYPFRMVISPTRNELAWLLGKEKSAQLSYNGSSSLALSGDGYTSGFNLSGEWNLTPATVTYSNYITKQSGTVSQAKFKSFITPKEFSVSSLNGSLGGLHFDISAKCPFEPGKNLDLLINTNQFNIENIAQMSPFLSRYQPSGRMQLSLRGTLPPVAKDFSWRGAVNLSNASFQYSQGEKPVSGLTGSISFSDDSMESSNIAARIGNTYLTGKGIISSINPVVFSTSFSSPHIDLADFGFRAPQKTPQITKVRGDLSFKENSLLIKGLSGNLNGSQLAISGTISDMEKLKAELAISSTHLDLADILLLDGVEKAVPKPPKTQLNPTIRATVKADRAVYKGTAFEKITTTINLASKAILIQPFEADLLGGRILAKGKIDMQTTPTTYQADFKLLNASADEITNLISGNKREITGVASIDGELSATGETSDLIKKSANGSIKLHATKGTLRHFSGLSKVFSILNISQLFKFKLPDMVSEGMPYTDIKGTLTIKDGIVATNDLFMASNAMNMSFVGKHDFINDNLDFTVGVQPLQTVDKVVSKIPIVGWILTGKEKTLISTYFEIKGKSTAPKVSAIPVTSLGKGVLGIFKRVFQLPAKLVTDTGEVILGN